MGQTALAHQQVRGFPPIVQRTHNGWGTESFVGEDEMQILRLRRSQKAQPSPRRMTIVWEVRPGGVVSSLGLEPRTHALKGRCSTN